MAELVEGVTPNPIVLLHAPEMRHGRKTASHPFNGCMGPLAANIENQTITTVDVVGPSALVPQTEQGTDRTVATVRDKGACGTV
jgi:hypothetical protein